MPLGSRAARTVVAALLAASRLATPAAAETFFDARVVGVIDGDTIDVLVGADLRRIRIADIDTPERGQPWAQRSKQALSRRVFGKEVRINEVAVDAYGRTVGEVYAENVCVGCELVREGHAWVYRAYAKDPVLLELEAEAREGRRGLWGLPEASRVPPWEWRRRGSGGGRDPGNGEGVAEADFRCGEKRTCREMRSCAEALFQLRECGLGPLDGDGDGTPCEAICRGR